MKRTPIGVAFVAAVVLGAACMAEGGAEGPSGVDSTKAAEAAALPGAREAETIVEALRARLEPRTALRAETNPGSTLPLAPFVSHATTIATEGDRLLPELMIGMERSGARVELPGRADGVFRLRHERAGMTVDVGLVGALPKAGEQAEGFVVYRDAMAGLGHVVHRPTSHGTEDYVYFPAKLPSAPELRYRIALGEGVAGLRLVERTLELVDSGGAPRLRMAAPYAVDGDGRRLDVRVAVEGCAYDDSPAAPWGRATVDPGARACVVRLQWDADAKAPLVVDPAWSDTEIMGAVRMFATASQLPNGLVLVAGGEAQQTALSSAELFNVAMNSWASTGSLNGTRSMHTATPLPSGFVLVVGGHNPAPLKTTEKYDPQQGKWISSASMFTERVGHTATLVTPGNAGGTPKVLIVGGRNLAGALVIGVDAYDTSTGNIGDAGQLYNGRAGHTASVMSNGKILFAGGEGDGALLKSTEIFNTSTGQWLQGPAMALPRAHHVAFAYKNKVIVGGGNSALANGNSAELYDDANPAAWSSAGNMLENRSFATVNTLQTGKLLVAGGYAANALSQTTETFDPLTGEWAEGPIMARAHSTHGSAQLPGGRVLVAGGSGEPIAEVLQCMTDADCDATKFCAVDGACTPRKGLSEKCDLTQCKEDVCRICASPTGDEADPESHCADGYCCDTGCTGQCEACNGLIPGKCSPVNGPPVVGHDPPRVDCITPDNPICGGQCNGSKRDACEYANGQSCGTTCADGQVSTLTCNGQGACATPLPPTSCGAYTCNDAGKACNVECDPLLGPMDPPDCALGYACNKDTKTCVARPTYCDPNVLNQEITETGDPKSCENYLCRDGACLTSCVNAYDCFGDNMVCTEGGVCLPFSDIKDAPSSGSCGCSIPGNDAPSRAPAWLALALAGGILSRRRRSS